MESIGKIILLGGMAIAFVAQIIGAGIAFKSSVIRGVLSLTVPGYLLFALQRSGTYWKVVGTWLVGILGMVLGTITLS